MSKPVPNAMMSQRVAFRFRLAARPQIPTLWYENEAGEQWVPAEGSLDAPPPGFNYLHSRFPRMLREEVLRVGGGKVMTADVSWPDDLVLAMVRPTAEELAVARSRHGSTPRILGMDDAILLAATSCERCLNALLWHYGTPDGYRKGSPEWLACPTSCAICRTPGVWSWLQGDAGLQKGASVVVRTAGVGWEKTRMILRIAARYKEKKKIKNKDGDERTVYVYSERQIALRNAEKAKKVEKLKTGIGKLRSKVKKDLRSSDPETKLTALAVALMDHTFERVGNDNSVEERGHFGVTGWQRGHLTFGRDGVSIRYTGKSGVKHHKKVTDDSIKKALRDAYEAVEDDDACLFEWEGGKVTAEKVNAYLEPFGVTAKDIRGYHANAEMVSALRDARKKGGALPDDKKERQKVLKDEFKAALEETAKAVGHEASTLRSQYLVPNLESTYVEKGEVLDSFK